LFYRDIFIKLLGDPYCRLTFGDIAQIAGRAERYGQGETFGTPPLNLILPGGLKATRSNL
jgi:hypothetical protein